MYPMRIALHMRHPLARTLVEKYFILLSNLSERGADYSIRAMQGGLITGRNDLHVVSSLVRHRMFVSGAPVLSSRVSHTNVEAAFHEKSATVSSSKVMPEVGARQAELVQQQKRVWPCRGSRSLFLEAW